MKSSPKKMKTRVRDEPRLKVKNYLPINIDKVYAERDLPEVPLEAGFRSDFVKTLNIARADGKYFANNMLELVLDRYKVDFGYMNFCNQRERRVDG